MEDKTLYLCAPKPKGNDLERSGKRVLGNAGKRGCRGDDLSRLGHQKKSFKKIFEIVLEIKKRVLLLPHFSPKKCGGKQREKETSSLKILRR